MIYRTQLMQSTGERALEDLLEWGEDAPAINQYSSAIREFRGFPEEVASFS